MTTLATHSKGTKLYIGDGASPEVFSAVKAAQAIPDLGQEKPDVDITNLDSLAREYMNGLGVGDDLEIEFIWDKTDTTGQVAMRTAYTNDTLRNFRVDFPDGTRASFAANVKRWGLGAAVDDAVRMRATLKISNDITWSDYTP